MGLIAEEVAEANSTQVARNSDGQPESVHYEMVNAMLLNEFIREHDAFLEEQEKVRKLEAALATVNERLKGQEAKIDTVSAAVVTNSTGPQVARVLSQLSQCWQRKFWGAHAPRVHISVPLAEMPFAEPKGR